MKTIDAINTFSSFKCLVMERKTRRTATPCSFWCPAQMVSSGLPLPPQEALLLHCRTAGSELTKHVLVLASLNRIEYIQVRIKLCGEISIIHYLLL